MVDQNLKFSSKEFSFKNILYKYSLLSIFFACRNENQFEKGSSKLLVYKCNEKSGYGRIVVSNMQKLTKQQYII